MKYLLLGMMILVMNGLSGCVPAFQGDNSNFEVDPTQQYFYGHGPKIMPKTSFNEDYKF
jgi:hypothetical protein